jgi:solute carrier family 35 (UDP-galactose transporter), member B1
MARTKQAHPVQRQPSTEYVIRQNPAHKDRLDVDMVHADNTNGVLKVLTRDTEEKEAGLLQLVIAVAGIYGSLYAQLPLILRHAFANGSWTTA